FLTGSKFHHYLVWSNRNCTRSDRKRITPSQCSYFLSSKSMDIIDPSRETIAVITKNIKLKATAVASSIPTKVCAYTKTNSRAPTPPMVKGNTATMEESKNTS